MGALHGIYHDLDGAPFRIGAAVRVVALTDETADDGFLGCQGAVLYFEYACGCGQTFPDDPMIGVRLDAGSAEFWKEELAIVSGRPVTKRPPI